MNDHIIRLIQEDIDGVLPESARAELQTVLDSDPEAASLHADLQRIGAAISAAPVIPAPADFTQRVMDRLPAVPAPARAADRPVASRVSAGWIDRVFAPSIRRTAFAFALGVLLTVVVIGTLDVDLSIDPAATSGAMSALAPTTTSIAIDEPAGVLRSSTSTVGTIIAASFVDTTTPFSIVLSGPAGIVDRILVPASAQGSIDRTGSGFTIDAQGSVRLLVSADHPAGEITVTVRQAGLDVATMPVRLASTVE